MPFNFI